MNRIYLFIVLVLVCTVRLLSQGDISVGYYGETLSHPGIGISLTQTFFEYKEVSLSVREEIITYTHPRNHNMIGVNIYMPLGFFKNYKVSGEIFIGSGYLMKFSNSDNVYYRDSSGEIKSNDFELLHKLSLNAGVGCRINLFTIKEKSVGLFIRPLAFWEYPVNNNLVIHPVLSVGVIYE